MASTRSRYSLPDIAPQPPASGPGAKTSMPAQQQQPHLPTAGGNSSATKQTQQQELQLPPNGGKPNMTKSSSRAQQPDENTHPVTERASTYLNTTTSSNNLPKTDTLASKPSKANSSFSTTGSPYAGTKTEDLAKIASQAVQRAKTAPLFQTMLSACPFGADVITPLVGSKVGFSTMMKRFPSKHPRHAELEKLSSGTQGYQHYRSIRGEPIIFRCALQHKISGLNWRLMAQKKCCRQATSPA